MGDVWMSWMEGRETPMIFSAVLTTLLTFFQFKGLQGRTDHFHRCVVDEKRGLPGLVLHEVNNDLLCFVPAPAHQLRHLLSVGQVVVVPDETHHHCVVCKLHNVVGGILGDTDVCHQSEEQRAQDTALRGTLAEGDDTAGVLLS